MEIRRLREGDDLFAVSRVYEESWKAAYRGLLPQAYLDGIPAGRWVPYLQQAGQSCLLLLDGATIAGVASGGPARLPGLAGWGEVVSLYLRPAYWGKGYGSLLFSAVTQALEEAGYHNQCLWVLEGNRRARDFYEKQGFAPQDIYLEDTIGGLAVREIQYRRNLKLMKKPKASKPAPSGH